MKKKKLLTYVFILGGLVLTILSGCQKENEPVEPKTYDIFADKSTNPYIQDLVKFLKEKGDTASFRRTFALEFGIPQWSKAQIDVHGGLTTMLIPLKDCDACFLSGIWVFEIKDGKISYYVLQNEPCKSYYKHFEPFFRAFDQLFFGNKTQGRSYRMQQSMLKEMVAVKQQFQVCIYQEWAVTQGSTELYTYKENLLCWIEERIVYIMQGPDSPPIVTTNYTGGVPILENIGVNTPCGKVALLSNMPGLASNLTTLTGEVNRLSYETGYSVSNRFGYTHFKNPEGDCNLPMTISAYSVALLHTHPDDCGNIFSIEDVKIFWDLWRCPLIDKTTFQLGLVAANGSTYFLSLSDTTKYAQFAKDMNFSGDFSAAKSKFETEYFRYEWSSTLLESKFLDFYKNAGLLLIKKDDSNGSWKSFSKDDFGNTNYYNPCNNQ